MVNKRNRVSKNELLSELVTRQLDSVAPERRLGYSDLKRICKYLESSIFDEENCSLWSGYVTNSNNDNKGTYINFYFRKKKVALHRLLYCNFVEDISDSEYLKFSCENKGRCCNIHHLRKFQYQKKGDEEDGRRGGESSLRRPRVEPEKAFHVEFD